MVEADVRYRFNTGPPGQLRNTDGSSVFVVGGYLRLVGSDFNSGGWEVLELELGSVGGPRCRIFAVVADARRLQ